MTNPIGSGNERGNSGIRVTFDKAHSGQPDHVDMTVPINTPFWGADKIKVDKDGNIIDHDHLSKLDG